MRKTPIRWVLCALPLALYGCGGAEEAPDAAADSAATAPGPAAPTDAFLDPNTAPAEQLMTVPGVDSALAAAVVAGRPYADNSAVHAVVSLRLTTEEQQDAFFSRVWTPLNLNSANEAEMLLIPRVGDQMAHEFEEYRPYDGIERFRREIGKYVDSTEVARLEKYVVIR